MKWADGDHPAERGADLVATAVFAAAVAFALGTAQASAPVAVITAAFAALLVFAVLRNVSPGRQKYVLRDFEPAKIEPVDDPGGAELLLDDELASLNPESRVVRLFDPRTGPGAGHVPASVQGDASKALSEALAELRRSLR